MTTGVVAVLRSDSRVNSSALAKASLVWLIPLLYPLSYPLIVQSVAWTRSGVVAGLPLFVLGLGWALAGPWAAWFTLNYLDGNGFDRRHYRIAVYGALLTAINPPFYNFLSNVLAQFNHAALRLPVWYVVNLLVATAALLPVTESGIAPVQFRRVHGYTAMLIALFALAHVSNHVSAIVSIDTHTTLLRIFRLIYRERLVEIALVSAVIMQALTGLTMVWKSRLRRAASIRNLQTVSGLFLAAFFLSHLRGTFSARLRLVDTTFGWATGAPAGLLAKAGSIGLLPYYILAVVMLFVHLGCQARSNLTRVVSEAAARKISYGIMTAGAVAASVIALAACGIHLIR